MNVCCHPRFPGGLNRTVVLCTCVMISTLCTGNAPPQPLHVATIQMEIHDSIDVNLQRIRRGIIEAAEAGTRMAVFPETALSGFKESTIAALDWDALKRAEADIRVLAGENNMYVLLRSVTRTARGNPYNSALLIGPDGIEITRYHKMGPEPWFAPGDHLTLFEIDGIACTTMICHDERYPEVTRLPVLAGAKICFYISYEINSWPSALRKADGYRAQLIARAVENGVWICQANGIGPMGTEEPGNRISLGQSRIVNPRGEVVRQAGALEDAMLVYDIDPAQARRGNALESLDLGGGLGSWWHQGRKLVQRVEPSSKAAREAIPADEADASRHHARLALMQSVPVKWDLEKNFATFLSMLDSVAEDKPDIFITPECWLDGYAAPDRSSTVDKLRGIAQPLASSRYLQRVSEEARQRSMYICFGFTSLERGKIYNAAGLWNDRGRLLGVYRKTHLQKHDLQYDRGKSLPTFASPWGPLGIMICADRRWPETARTLRLKGARLILNPTYGMHHEKNEWWMRTRGYENQCFIAFTHPEVGFVVDPMGDLAGKRDGPPGVLVVDVDLQKAKEDNHLRDRRPELYRVITEMD